MMSTTTPRRKKPATTAIVAISALMAGITAAESAFAQQVVPGNRRASAAQGPVVNRVVIEGNKRVEKALIEDQLQARARAPYNQAAVDADVQRILEVYRRSGRGLAQVTPRLVDLPNGTVDVVYTINEGDKTGVEEIRFVGNNQVSSSRLRGIMQTTETNLLSFLKSTDVYDPDRLSNDLDLIRRYYLKNGYADYRLVSSDVQFDPNEGGYVITITVDEGEQYRFGSVSVDPRLGGVDAEAIRRGITTSEGSIYNAEAVEKSVQALTSNVGRQGNPFAQVRPVGTRDPSTRTVNLAYVVEEGPRIYIERINVRGNSRTRDYVIRREFELGEGDAYNQVLVDRAERRLNNLGYFKRVRISNEPGSSADRVVVNVDVEDQSTGSFAISGGYSTADGFIGEVSVTETNFLGRGQFVRLAGQLGQRAHGVDFSFTEPYFLGYRMSAGIDLFSKFSDQTRYSRYENRMTGGTLRLGLPMTEEFTITARYSLYQQSLDIPNDTDQPFNDCSAPIPGYTQLNANGTPNRQFCEGNGEASLAIKESQGDTITSLAGLTFNYNTLDSVREPRNGFYAEVKTDFAGLGGDSRYFRVTGDARYYREFFEDVVGIARLQGGHIMGFNGGDDDGNNGDLRIVDHFFMGPSLVRGFAPNGIGPRDISSLDSRANAIGGTTYFGGTLEVQFPIWGLPRELGLKGAVFADAGTLFGYEGPTTFNGSGSILDPVNGCAQVNNEPQNCIEVLDSEKIRSSVGASILWTSPLGPIRFDYAFALSKEEGVWRDGTRVGADRTQAFRFSGGTRF
ncbi:outer membrane protein assembly factor BamA [Microvirga tunisiensis]|jgi:outer membrane protein insertion porin family|uniref:Outer membrane protein assembly factor BamA n=1 Tax=Microvirga tunisiensis TaxID=2108360 RepID=A0A5N7MCI7_9HYPH|nr:outer membrane protein assembly factor BamA [Microvirga tunisiensis]MPR06015.1 outer membrane protein assembly factor BamA [Microvirga tunisiensis]MPR24350.1 outer membrane protein assembly factor BamA [Microvirga tunisiensis]